MREVHRGQLVWADFSPTRGHEQSGEGPALIVASNDYLEAIPNLVIALPITTVDRRWPHHVRLAGDSLQLPQPGWALTEQPRAISRDRLTRSAGQVGAACLAEIDQ